MASPSYLGLCCLFVFSLISLQAGETESSVQLVSPHVGKPVITKAVAANRLASVPDYVSAFEEEIAWLDFGLDSRSRFEFRDQDYRTSDLLSESVFFQRSLVYLGIHDVLDPLRAAFEFEDSRRGLSERAESANDANHTELLQAYGELHFADAFDGDPVSVRFGRMAFDASDRRLIARNRYRNTINAFDGLRLRIGEESSLLEWDAFALRPVERSVDALDESSEEGLLYGVTGYLRAFSPQVVIEPYWLLSDQVAEGGKHLHTGGVHTYGQFGKSAWDYDFDFAGQWGESAGLSHQAWAAHAEIGHSWDHPWKPRLGAWLNFASGDRNPIDGESGRFDPLYGATFAFYGYSGYFSWQNMINPALRLSFQPMEKLRCEIIHRGIWLAGEHDAWVRGSRQNAIGGSGNYVGQELDLRASWQATKHLEIEAVFASFFPGEFVEATGPSPGSQFGYLAATLRF
ncbi:MAG: alginate export family protein [Verrucomicrobiales bacterium]|jgi:hypothetical protein|nr:alginate export family protein [Verrucomicrobiales bacterium]